MFEKYTDEPEPIGRIRIQDRPPQRELITATLLMKEFNNKGIFLVQNGRLFRDKNGIEKPCLDVLGPNNREMSFILNKMNQYILSDMGYKYLDELFGKRIAIAVYETGGIGKFKYGAKIVEVLE